MSNYTPGPWALHYEKYITGIENDPENGCVGPVDIGHVYLRTVPGKAEANARLIVSAPDLLEALRFYMSQFGQDLVLRGIPFDKSQTEADEKARDAIFKATGSRV